MTKKNSEKQETQAQAGVDAPEVVEVEADEVAAEREGDTAANGAPEAIELDPAELLETIARLEAELAEANQQAAEVTEKSQRLAAEFQNSRRRQERQLAEQIERSSMHLIKRLLPAMDDFDLAFANVPEATDAEAAWIDGFRQIQRKLRQLLEEEGVTPIATEGAFDPTLHEAIASAPSDSVEPGHIIDTLRAGYQLKGHVLRPALVRVAM
ncbi:MAG: nucleotide exchange factor GrpE [Caldilinea sp.]|nr:nucleotide exchange factor GrpE [Caldilinea sp.]MCB0057048.1 nucleotide exchange factor GrpE [Caldilineaceae bacterium]MCB0134227.1 nucleotide exchange factor GrpE [Caldilineaceae bacterium]MCB9114084.1 nucleotide exchange factor GrpE [Caldilineaceae bacterium]MCB9118430.1 nucleotide exchange factor GrpE [Caldilineaceae bacterium]